MIDINNLRDISTVRRKHLDYCLAYAHALCWEAEGKERKPPLATVEGAIYSVVASKSWIEDKATCYYMTSADHLACATLPFHRSRGTRRAARVRKQFEEHFEKLVKEHIDSLLYDNT